MNESATIRSTAATYGGKGAALLQLRELGYPVPPFVILPAEQLQELVDTDSRLTDTAIQTSGKLRSLLREAAVLSDGSADLAVRSSATVEDGAGHSFAGQFRTELNVTAQGLSQAIARVWMSGFSDSVAAYKRAGGIEGDHHMAVIIQKMVNADAAGVGFGMHPMRADKAVVLINAVRGLGESLVNGSANADTYEVNPDHQIQATLQQPTPVLSDGQVLQVAQTLRSLERSLGAPQDIEFAFEGEALFLLQSRPITVRPDAPEGRTVWDNSNIVESYPGLTLPLTYSFIQKMYAAVYQQFTLVLGVSPGKVSAHEEVFASMLGLLNGRVYYNLNSWYAALALLPGYAINAAYMEAMMGVKEPPPIPMPAPPKAGIRDYLDVLSALAAILRNLRRARKSKEEFILQFDEVYQRFRMKDFSSQNTAQTIRDYHEFETLMLARWKAPLVNDFFAMIYFGLLRKLTARHLPEHSGLHNELISASKDIITIQPLLLLPGLAALLARDEGLRSYALSASPEELWSRLQLPPYAAELQQINAYLEAWGERCVAELKLEAISYLQDPPRLMAILQSYLKDPPRQREAGSSQRVDAEALMAQALHGKWLARRIFNHVLRQARYFVSNRENLRYYRTKGFGLVRRMMLGIGQQLAPAGYLGEARDVFYLKLDEVKSLAQDPQPMQELVASRKRQYSRYAAMPLPERIITDGPLPEYIIAPPGAASTGSQDESLLQGTPCSAGVVRARVRLVQDAGALASLDGAIMATYATDPGFVVLFATAAGILTERGSLLSHAAIVSREMGIPCIVGIEGLMERLKDGDEVVMDGKTGTLQIITTNEQP